MSLISPLNVLPRYSFGDHKVEYSKLHEVIMDGPPVGFLYVNDRRIFSLNDLFGGPPIFFDDYIAVPKYSKKFIFNGFKLFILNMKSYEHCEYNKLYDLVLLKEFNEEVVTFYTDFKNTKLKTLCMSDICKKKI